MSMDDNPERPYILVFDRTAHQLEPGGPRRARDQDEHCVSRHTPKTHPLEIRPHVTEITIGLVKSYCGPTLISKATEAKPACFKLLDTLPEPANNSKKIFCCVCETFLKASSKASSNFSLISPGERLENDAASLRGVNAPKLA
jgi:hypothetical protein